ncbi:hypothetical protein HTV45_28470 [Streptomyces sp. CHD11]|uniref:hypothetical protein n=1 Tax=Streptomyces sp. CHD11 TaxID=2741325 RepID=UPI001BFCA2BB|nr:hypothetical protein [Streptomyces sp. CHD11]MBT3154760.1 hypothetical protein [Streptomyces sp. CHD11]
MTQSGQGEEPSQRPAREGIVLPSDGGEPLLPGMTAGPVAPGGSADGRPPAGGFPASAPPGGQTWGTPWGPGQRDSGRQGSGSPSEQDGQSPSDGRWGVAEPSSWGDRNPPGGGQGPGPLPPEGARPASPAYGGHPGPDGGADAYGARHGADPGHQPYGATPGPHAQPDGGYGGATASHGGADAYGARQGGGYGDATGPHGGADAYGARHGANAGHQPYGATPGPHAQPDGGYGAHPGQDGAAGAYGSGYGAPAHHAYGASPAAGGPMPPAAPDGSEGATQFLPPVPAAGADEGATQFIPPVGPGALPPEMPAAHHSEDTRYLGLSQQNAPGGDRLPPSGGPDAEATQYIAPVTGQPPGQPYGVPAPPPGDGNRQPPAEFDSLFRDDAAGPAGSTQQLPRVEYGGPGPAAPTAYPAGPGDGGRGGRGGRGGGRSGSRLPVIVAVGVGIAVLGVGAGALIGSGGDDGDDNQTVAASAPATQESSPSPSPTVDPAREQAVELDKLLAVSGDSRTTVINAVADVKACRELGRAAKDLREAAGQRNKLVTDLAGLSVDKLPGQQALTSALTKAWKASASADNHYAAWADQVAGKKGCKKGQARSTKQTEAGNRESGTATAEKGKAAGLWNKIAKQYGLTERQPTQL